ncbi:DUF1016 family protein [Treponema rectale]|uniref:DUF1016 family protein n=1 Tax=Treponema rectale TaxID=744512 RepID=A0A7M1XNI0_9SPIR|nr:DUF1016 family protein [Treponema rectale]
MMKHTKHNRLRLYLGNYPKKFGKGFSRANIWNMIHFYHDYGSVQSLTERLTWTHYCELLSINDKEKRPF